MTIRVLLSSAASAVVVFAWGFVFWGLSGASQSLLSSLPDPARDDLLAVLRRDNLAPGMYIYPAPAEDSNDQQALDEFQERYEQGPLLRMALHEGGPPMPPSVFAMGVALNFAYALLAGVMVAMAGASLSTFGRRVAFLLVFSLAGAIWTNLSDVVWWFHPVRYGLGNAGYQFVAGLLTALIVAAIVRPAAPDASADAQ